MNPAALAQGSVQKEARARGADVWIYRYRDGIRHRSTLLGRTDRMTEAAAHKKAHRLRAQLFENRTRVTVGSLIDRYEKEEMPARQSTAGSYRSMLRRIRSDWEKVELQDFLVDVGAIERWLRGMQTLPRTTKAGKLVKAPEPVTIRTMRHFKTMVYRLVECAMRWSMVDIQRNSVGLVEIRSAVKRRRNFTVLSLVQYRAVIDRPELGKHGRMLAQLAMCLGLRASEALGLKWDQVNLLEGVVSIRQSSVGRYQDGTKTDTSQADLPLHSELVQALMEWRKAAPVIDGWVFGSPLTNRPYHRDSLQADYLTPAAKAAGLPRLGWHDFRHTHRAMLRDLGLPLEVQQQLMRHASISMTVAYGSESLTEAKREANRMLVEHVTAKENSTRIN